jgi:hypothetical protein
LEITSNTQTTSSGLLNKKPINDAEENTTSFEDSIKKNEEEKKSEDKTLELKRTTDELVADIISLLKTGMTEGEVEALQKLLRELKDKIKEGEYSPKEIENMLSELEQAIQALQKRILGQVIIEAKDSNSLIKEENSDDSMTAVNIAFLNRIEDAMTSLEELKTGKTKKEGLDISANESELLMLIKEFQK